MGFWIVTGNFHKRVDLSEELVDRFHEGIKRKLVKDNTGNDSFTITQNEAKTLVVIHRENNTLEGIIALTGGTVFAPRKDKNIGDNVPGDMNVGDNVPGDMNFDGDVPDVRLPWREDQDWENWDAKDDFWKKVDDIDKFFGRYPCVSLIKIIPEAAILFALSVKSHFILVLSHTVTNTLITQELFYTPTV